MNQSIDVPSGVKWGTSGGSLGSNLPYKERSFLRTVQAIITYTYISLLKEVHLAPRTDTRNPLLGTQYSTKREITACYSSSS